MWLTSSSIGRKFIMALTGAFLILFVTFHVLMNGVALFWPSAYNVVCEFLGANWYALVGTLVLAGGFALHILYALWLTWENRCARGGDRYKVTSRPPQVEWASKNMLVLGIVIICFMVVHLWQFWAKMQLVEILHLPSDMPPAAGTYFIQEAFSCPWTLIIYIIGFIALWFHMTHGFWSMCHSSGLDNKTWMPRLKCIGNVWATVVCGLFLAEAIVFTVSAKNESYLNCPELQQQYIDMQQAGLEAGHEYPMLVLEGVPAANMAFKGTAAPAAYPGECGNSGDCAVCPENGCTDCAEGHCDVCPKDRCAPCGRHGEHSACPAGGHHRHHHGHHADCPHAAGCPAEGAANCPAGEQAPVENQVSETLPNNI